MYTDTKKPQYLLFKLYLVWPNLIWHLNFTLTLFKDSDSDQDADEEVNGYFNFF